MRKLLLIAALGCLSYTASAQGGEKQSRIMLNIGAASPSGDFGGKNIEGEKDGFAKTGALISAGYAMDLNKNFAFGATLGWRNNPTDIDAIVAELGGEEAGMTKAEATSWRTTYLTADAYAQLPLEKLNLYAKGSVGYGFSNSSGLDLEGESEWGSYEITQSEAKSNAPVFGLGVGLRYDFGKFGLGAEVGMFSTTPEFEYEYDGEKETLKQPMTTVNTTLQLSYRL
ncbi:outer membrane beta-barrel protein [Pontibacter pudoricolor]|uniref:outer membrane beta-barrel protein n=1 Tax=Pontibacter pudoricolor TaxID=2694930 RepID=UPI0013919B70|nr:outer membrane beta-barrel protein [Pontibacter pudoricolor]